MPAAATADLSLADRRHLAAENVRLAYHIAHRFRDRAAARGLEPDDLAQEAALQVWVAALKYDPERGPFVALAGAYAAGAVLSALRAGRHRAWVQLPEKNADGVAAEAEDARAEGPGERAGRDDLVRQLLRQLTPRERAVVTLRFGLRDGCARPLSQVARDLGLSKGRVRQIEARALARLRRAAGQDSGDGGGG